MPPILEDPSEVKAEAAKEEAKEEVGISEVRAIFLESPLYKGILLFGGQSWGSLIFLNPKPETLNPPGERRSQG